MTVQPPGVDPQAPPPATHRRRRDRRASDVGRRAADRTQLLRTGVIAATTICGGLAILFLFFALLGTIDFENAIGSVIIAVVLALVWIAGFVYRHRVESDTAIHRDRERRGF